MKNTITKMQSALEEINSTLNDTEEWISKLKDRVVKITEAEEMKRKKNKKKGGQYKRLWRQHQAY